MARATRMSQGLVLLREEITDTLQDIFHVIHDDDYVDYCKRFKVLIEALEKEGYDINVQIKSRVNVIS